MNRSMTQQLPPNCWAKHAPNYYRYYWLAYTNNPSIFFFFSPTTTDGKHQSMSEIGINKLRWRSIPHKTAKKSRDQEMYTQPTRLPIQSLDKIEQKLGSVTTYLTADGNLRVPTRTETATSTTMKRLRNLSSVYKCIYELIKKPTMSDLGFEDT